MTTPLPTNVDATYGDGTDASTTLHQQWHDALHKAYNGLGDGPFVLPIVGGLHKVRVGDTSAAGAGRVNYIPVTILKDCTLDTLSVSVSFAGAGGVGDLGIYSSSTAGLPATKLASGTIAADTTGIKSVVVGPLALTRGLYFLAFAASAVSFNTFGTGSQGNGLGTRGYVADGSARTGSYSHAGTTLPTTAAISATSTSNDHMPNVGLTFSAVTL